jgi:hypothetical protein
MNEMFLTVDIMKVVLLKRMEREAKLVLHDEFLSDKQRMAGFTLYREIGADFGCGATMAIYLKAKK